jgi:hypothetical protein
MKNYVLRLATLVMLVLAFSCDDDSGLKEPKPNNIFALKVDENYGLNQGEHWLLLHDVSGKLLAMKSFNRGDQIEIELDETVQELNITVFIAELKDEMHVYQFFSYLKIKPGEFSTLKYSGWIERVTSGNNIGTFTVKINDVGYGIDAHLSDVQGRQSTEGQWQYSSETSLPEAYSLVAPLFDTSSKWCLSFVGSDRIPRYKMFENISDGDHFEVTPSDLLSFDKTTEISFPATQNFVVSVFGLPEDQPKNQHGFITNLFGATSTHDHLTLGYLDELTFYRSFIQLTYDDYGLRYEKSGPSITAVEFPTASTIEFKNSSIHDFEYTGDEFVRRSSTWTHWDTNSVPQVMQSWQVHAPNDAVQRFDLLPTELLEMYPTFVYENFEHLESVFYIQSESYTDSFPFLVGGAAEPETYERMSFIFR